MSGREKIWIRFFAKMTGSAAPALCVDGCGESQEVKKIPL